MATYHFVPGSSDPSLRGRDQRVQPGRQARGLVTVRLAEWLEGYIGVPWPAHTGSSSLRRSQQTQVAPRPLYTPEQRARRDNSIWTTVQAILAPLQFVVFLTSLYLVLHYLQSGRGYEMATASIVAKTLILYVIMLTGSIWEKVVFGKWLFAESFFWEDVFSMLVLGLQTLYLAALIMGWWSREEQMMIAVAAYATYVINAAQFMWKLRIARLEGNSSKSDRMRNFNGQPA